MYKRQGFTLLALVVAIIAIALPSNSFLRADDGTLLGNSPLMEGIIVIIALVLFIPSVVYGRITGAYKGEKDVCSAMGLSLIHI